MRTGCWVFGVLAMLSGCLASPETGAVVSEGVAAATFEVRARSTDVVRVRVLFPANAAGEAVGVRHPAFVFVQGGFVGVERYEWLAESLAREGYVVAMPRHELDLAFFAVENGDEARRLLVEPPVNSLLVDRVDTSRIAVGGHSLGGVVATKLALQGGFNALVLEASYPDAADVKALETFTKPSLSLAGGNDCSAPLEKVKAGWDALPSPTALSVLSGVTHYQFTNSDAEDVAKGCASGVTLDEAHARIAASVSAFLGAVNSGQGIGEDALRAVPGAEVTVR